MLFWGLCKLLWTLGFYLLEFLGTFWSIQVNFDKKYAFSTVSGTYFPIQISFSRNFIAKIEHLKTTVRRLHSLAQSRILELYCALRQNQRLLFFRSYCQSYNCGPGNVLFGMELGWRLWIFEFSLHAQLPYNFKSSLHHRHYWRVNLCSHIISNDHFDPKI